MSFTEYRFRDCKQDTKDKKQWKNAKKLGDCKSTGDDPAINHYARRLNVTNKPCYGECVISTRRRFDVVITLFGRQQR